MTSSVRPLPVRRGRAALPLDARPLAYALARMTPGLTALILPGEDWDEMMARREAAADILDDLLSEAADEIAEAEAAAETWRVRLSAAGQLLDLVNEELAAAQATVDRIAADAQSGGR